MKDLRIHVILLHKNKGIKCPHCDYFTYPKVANEIESNGLNRQFTNHSSRKSSVDKHVKRVHEKSAVPEKIWGAIQ